MRVEDSTFTRGSEGGVLRRPLLTLVIPTRNEVENVPALVEGLRSSLEGLDYRVVFVDDSTDDTPRVISKLSDEDSRIGMIHREGKAREGGLSTAVTAGLDLVSADSVYTCVMDADLQHPPEKVREMLEEARSSRSDVVVASRYIKGGDYSGLDGPMRKAVSAGSKSLAQILFKEARKTTDPMSGFFLVRNEAISGIQLRPTGFKILLEILVCAPEVKVSEVPLKFQARHSGVSKATFDQGTEYLSHIASLFWFVPSAGRFWKFAVVGASGVVVNNAIFFVLAQFVDAAVVIAWMFGVGASILSNFLLNNAFTWRDVRHSSRIHFFLRGVLAYPVAVIGIGANFAVFYPLSKYVSSAFPELLIFNMLGIVAGTAVNFMLSSRLIFRPASPAQVSPDLSPDEAADEVRRELKADWVALFSLPDITVEGRSSGNTLAPTDPDDSDHEVVGSAARTAQPRLTVTGPRRYPQARTNTRWATSLAVPIIHSESVAGVIYATRNSAEPFTTDDLYWLTAYVRDAAPIFRANRHVENSTRK